MQHHHDLDGCEETKLIGVYSTAQAADKAVRTLKVQPGFRDHADGFSIDEYELNRDHWVEGFVTD